MTLLAFCLWLYEPADTHSLIKNIQQKKGTNLNVELNQVKGADCLLLST